jgi:hypothetical protein
MGLLLACSGSKRYIAAVNRWHRLTRHVSLKHAIALGALFGSVNFGACEERCGLCSATNAPKAWPNNPACIENETSDEYCTNNCERCLRKVVGRLGKSCLDQAWTTECAKIATMICASGAC